jgi:hypothetical protein
VPFGEPGLVVEDLAPAGLDPAMIAVDRLRHIVEHGIGIVDSSWMSSRSVFWLPLTAST